MWLLQPCMMMQHRVWANFIAREHCQLLKWQQTWALWGWGCPGYIPRAAAAAAKPWHADAYRSTCHCLLRYYSHSRHVPISLPFFGPAATKGAREGLNWLLRIYFTAFLSQPSPFQLRGALCCWWNDAIKFPQSSPYWPLGGSRNTAYSLAALAAFN